MKTLIISLMLMSTVPDDLTPHNVYAYCVEQNILHPEIVTAQSIQETGWYKCTNCSLNRNNIFGFFYKGKYLKYESWKESVEYYKRWQDKRYDPSRDYYEFLACMYKNRDGECIKYAQDPIAYERHVRDLVANHADDWSKGIVD